MDVGNDIFHFLKGLSSLNTATTILDMLSVLRRSKDVEIVDSGTALRKHPMASVLGDYRNMMAWSLDRLELLGFVGFGFE